MAVLTGRRELRRRRRRRRRVVAVGVVAVVALGATPVVMQRGVTSALSDSLVGQDPVPSASASTRARIVSLVEGQVGYTTSPSQSYCNKFSAYWFAGATDCANSNRDEQWCADFAAWAWRRAGVPLVYQFINGDVNSSSASFYEWGMRHHTWHPVGSGYVPQPGDVALYGLDAAALTAQHVAVVVSFTRGERGPNAVNGDGNHTGFSRVEYQSNEFAADSSGSSLLSGYVAPNA